MKELTTISLNKLKQRLTSNGKAQAGITIKDNPSFKIEPMMPHGYVEPIMTPQPTALGCTPYQQAQIILISAPGATGKSAMTKYLSHVCQTPVFNLAAHEPVGSYSFVGMLFRTLPSADLSGFLQGLNDGSRSVMIDALDEGKVKTSQGAFESFLTDLADIATASSGLPFVIFGRTSVLEYAALYFEEKGVRVSLLQIEPFTIVQAKTFIDNHIENGGITKFASDYKEVRDHIIESIEGFFHSESDIHKKMYSHFIGYAPVLLSIATLLEHNRNYHTLLQELKDSNAKNVELVVEILSQILKREQVKIQDPLNQLLKGRDKSFNDDVKARAYQIREQCARLLFRSHGVEYVEHLTDDEDFNAEYNKMIAGWQEEHPFTNTSGEFSNVVFQAFVIVNLVNVQEHRDLVLNYMESRGGKGNSYLLYDLYRYVCGTDVLVAQEFLPYLIESFQLLDKPFNKGRVTISSQEDGEEAGNDDTVMCDAEFFRSDCDDDSERFVCAIKKTQPLLFGPYLSNVIVDAGIMIEFNGDTLEMAAPVVLQCDRIDLRVFEIQFTPSLDKKENSILLESPVFVSESTDGSTQTINDKSGVNVQVITSSTLYFPIVRYKEAMNAELLDDKTLFDKYQKLRRILLHFHSHSKGKLAKYKKKISKRFAPQTIGGSLVEALLNKGVLLEDETMYYIDQKALSNVLGVNFSGVRSYDLSDKLQVFLREVN